MNLSHVITSQFQNPRGFLGNLAGMIMAWENRERNTWVIELLDVQRADYILEIGFGPGWAIQQAARLATEGLVAGVDASKTMVRQASAIWHYGERDRSQITGARSQPRMAPNSRTWVQFVAKILPFDLNGL